MNAQDSANHIVADLDAERQRDLLSNAGTAPFGIAPFHCNDSVDEVFLRSLRTRAVPALGRKQRAVFSFTQHRADVAEWKPSERWRNGECVPGAGTGCTNRR